MWVVADMRERKTGRGPITSAALITILTLTARSLVGCRYDENEPPGNTGPGATVARVDIVAGRSRMAVGDTVTFVARAYDNASNVLALATIRWTSSAPAVLAVDSVSGFARARARGSAQVTATAGSALSFPLAVAVDP